MINLSYDTNILIDGLKGHPGADDEFRRDVGRWISRVTWIEVMAGATRANAASLERYMAGFQIDELDDRASRRAAALRRERPRLKLPDAIILASAQVNGRTLVTRNIRDFLADQPGIRVPYSL